MQQLKKGKAVPETSVPAGVWLLCPQAVTSLCVRVFNQGNAEHCCYPTEVTDCALSLLPKPGKTGRRPQDLRPLGLQDPGSKTMAIALRARAEACVSEFLAAKPQFAYCKGKSTDDAICRVALHCSRVRERLQRGNLSLHAKRSGARESTCYGGIMVSVDLSRAFDQLPRSSLEASMAHAGIPPELRHAILAVHESCSYRVSHGPHSRTFAMARRVRQGCALSPVLYSIYDQLVEGTNEEWASKLATLFADDSHIAFEIESQDDLGFALRAVRKLFELFSTTGMCVNPGKSSVALSLKGSAAKRWIRQHTCMVDGKHAINFGYPGQPLLVPKANSMVYLGVVASYGRYEVATFQHRLKAAIQNKQRLQRILHCQCLSLRYRVRLYVACVRSTLLYGLHAVGFSHEVLRQMVTMPEPCVA